MAVHQPEEDSDHSTIAPPSDHSSVVLKTRDALFHPGETAAPPLPVRTPDLLCSPLDWLVPGAAEAPLELTLTLDGGQTLETLQVDTPLFVIGRDSRSDLRLAHPDIGRRHALIQRFGEAVLFLDLGSRKGIRRNGRLERFGWLAPGDELTIGPYQLSRPVVGDPGTPALPAPEDLFRRRSLSDEGVPSLQLRLLNAPGDPGRSLVPLERPITLVGRDELCKLRLRDVSVSRVHLSLILTRQGLLAIDLLSRTGLAVNGRLQPQALLRAGDRVTVGKYLLEVVERERSAPPQQASPVSVGPIHVTGGVSESFVLAVIGMLGDLQRQVQEQSVRQLEMVTRLLASERSGRESEIAAELGRLREVAAEMLDVQRRMLAAGSNSATSEAQALPPAVSPATDDSRPVLSVAGPTNLERESSPHAPRGTGASTRRSAAAASAVRVAPSQDGLAEHLWLGERLRELERERTTRWQRLMRLLGAADG